jgi:energy-coupling factor transporter ATP-binding protein EcfA2
VDEALAMLDAAHRRGARAFIAAVCREGGLALGWATHDVEEALAADRIVVLEAGRAAQRFDREAAARQVGALARAGLSPSPLLLVRERLLEAGLDLVAALDAGSIAEAIAAAPRAPRQPAS